MALIRDGQLIDDPFVDVSSHDTLPASGNLIVSLNQWLEHRDELAARDFQLGVRLTSSEHPETIESDLTHFAAVALEFPVFRDGRAYSYARLLRERYQFAGEIRAVGEVLLEQLHYMHRVGFNAFEIDSATPLEDFATAQEDFSVWYQPAADDRPWATRLRHGHTAET